MPMSYPLEHFTMVKMPKRKKKKPSSRFEGNL